MTDQHPITPPPELVRQWVEKSVSEHDPGVTYSLFDRLATQAARWGADHELDACCELIRGWYGSGCGELISELRAARRPKPPSLKEQAYAALDTYIYGEPDPKDKERTYNIIRHALEQLNE